MLYYHNRDSQVAVISKSRLESFEQEQMEFLDAASHGDLTKIDLFVHVDN